MNTYCNPLSIKDVKSGRWLDTSLLKDGKTYVDYRSISDPSVIYHEGKWIMYPSYAVAYVSEDFVHWEHVDIGIPHLRYSPAVVCFEGKWYLNGHGMRELYVADSPLGPFSLYGHFKDLQGEVFRPVDACFLADDGHLYIYYHGTTSADGEDVEMMTCTYGAELDPKNPCQLISEPVVINRFNSDKKWQCAGEENQNTRVGWIEGQWMKKIGSRYYMLYSANGTDHGSYANGVVYSDEGPLSGFKDQTHHDPLTRKHHGLMRGAGHGSFVEGPNNTLWVFYTCIFCFNHKFERRIGMDPLGIDENGELYCPKVTETPQFAPGVLEHPEEGNDTGWDALTFMCRPEASSNAPGREALYASDYSVITWWQPAKEDKEPTIRFCLGSGSLYDVHAIRLIWRDIGMETNEGIDPGPISYVVEYNTKKGSEDWICLIDASQNQEDLCIDYRTFDAVRAQEIRLRILDAPKGITPGLVSLTAFGKCVKQ